MLEDLNLDNTEDKDHPDELTEFNLSPPKKITDRNKELRSVNHTFKKR